VTVAERGELYYLRTEKAPRDRAVEGGWVVLSKVDQAQRR
jgi:hypothetical protein